MPSVSVFDADDAALAGAAYMELRQLASRILRGERADHTLQTTALVHEAWLKLGGAGRPESHDRFLALAATAMRRILVDHERRRRRLKRGGGVAARVVSEGTELAAETDGGVVDILGLEDALVDLAALAPRQARVVELRFHGGLSNADVARILGVSERTIEREWVLAKSFLKDRLGGG